MRGSTCQEPNCGKKVREPHDPSCRHAGKRPARRPGSVAQPGISPPKRGRQEHARGKK